MPETKRRTISYRRAVWDRKESSYQGTLREAVQSCLEVVGSRETPLRNGLAQVRHKLARSGPPRLFLHVAAWTPKESASTVPHDSRTGDLDQRSPGEKWDFLDGDGMYLICEDHCLIIPSGIHPRTLERYLWVVLGEAGGFERARNFGFVNVFDRHVAERVAREPIKSVELDLSGYWASGSIEEQSLASRFLHSFFGTNEALWLDSDNLIARLTVKRHGRRLGLSNENFSSLARRFADENEANVVELVMESGKRIKYDRLIVSKPVDVTSVGKTIKYNEAWEEMDFYLTELADSGILVV